MLLAYRLQFAAHSRSDERQFLLQSFLKSFANFVQKVFFNPEETEVLYSDDEKKEVPEEIVEVIPQPVEMAPTAKILNYFKRND